MDTSEILHDQITVEELLQRWPETWVVFKSKTTQCMGCFMQRFCSLREVAEAYQLPLQDLIEELEKCVNQSKKAQRSIS
jgi:hypothetical protein